MSDFERKFGKYAVRDLSLKLIILYLIGYAIYYIRPEILYYMTLNPYAIVHGQVWRLVSWLLIPPSASNLFFIAIMMFFYLFVMLRYSVLLTIIGIVTMMLNLLVSRLISAKRVNITRVQMRDAGKLAAATVSGIQMVETIKASGAENGYFQKWAGYQASVNAQSVRYAKLNQYLGVIPELLSAVADAAVLIIGVWLSMEGRFSLGMILSFQGFLGAFMSPAMTLISAGQMIQEMRTDMERVEDVMRYPEDPYAVDTPYAEDRDYSKLSGSIELKDVCFGYSRLAEPLIRDFSMSMKPGSRVAFVGSSGCGKSTLSKLTAAASPSWAAPAAENPRSPSSFPACISPGAGRSSLTGSPYPKSTAACSPARWRWWIRISRSLRIPSPTTSRCGINP